MLDFYHGLELEVGYMLGSLSMSGTEQMRNLQSVDRNFGSAEAENEQCRLDLAGL